MGGQGIGEPSQGRREPAVSVLHEAVVRAPSTSGSSLRQFGSLAIVLLILISAIAARATGGGAGSGPPDRVDGLGVQTVGAVIAARTTGELGSQPFAVGGYWSDRTFAHACRPPTAPPGVLELYCVDGEYGIAQLNEPAMIINQNGSTISANGPFLTPWVPKGVQRGGELFSLPSNNGKPFPPVPIVLVGHFDDQLAKSCRAEAQTLCKERMVVDAIAYFDPATAQSVAPEQSADGGSSTALLSASDCAGEVAYTFVGWTTTKDLGLPFDRPGPVFAMVTSQAVLLGGPEWNDPRADGQHRYRIWGRMICIAERDMPDTVEFGFVPASTFVEWDDGIKTPGEVPAR